MDNFRSAVDELIYAWAKVSQEWDRLDEEKAAYITQHYPFDEDFKEMLHRLMDWRSNF